MNRYTIILLLLVFTQSCEDDGYHYLSRFANRQQGEQKALEELLKEYDELDRGYYKIIYDFPGKNTELKNVIWYDKELRRLGVEIGIYSGMCCTWENVDQSVLRTLVSKKEGIQKSMLSASQIYPASGGYPYYP